MTDIPAPTPPGLWRRFTRVYAEVLSALLAVTVAIAGHPGQPADLLALHRVDPVLHLDRGDGALPVHLDDHDRRHDRRTRVHAFRGRRIGRRCAARRKRSARLLGRLGVLAAALRVRVCRHRVHRFAWNRTSELADLPLWLIHVAWPVTGVTWIVFLGEQVLDDLKIIFGRAA